jgi:hypothetical protein
VRVVIYLIAWFLFRDYRISLANFHKIFDFHLDNDGLVTFDSTLLSCKIHGRLTSDYLLRPGVEHEGELPVHVAPAGKHRHAQEEQKHLQQAIFTLLVR